VTLQIAKDDRNAIAIGESVDLLVEHSPQFGVRALYVPVTLRRQLCRAPFVLLPSIRIRPEARSGAKGDLMEPGPQRVSDPECAGLPDQDEESGLEGVLCVVRVGQQSAADAHDHRAMTLDQGRESQLCDLALPGRETLEQLPVRELPDHSEIEERAELP
jgi:hypothetical protein